MQASTLSAAYVTQPQPQPHTHTHVYGGAAQLRKIFTVSVSWPSALNCNPWTLVPLTVLWRLCPATPLVPN